MDRLLSQIFFFQAEDGIRDIGVTGVQTCALPISRRSPPSSRRWQRCRRRSAPFKSSDPSETTIRAIKRSEERRVGKECRTRRAAYHKKRKKEAKGTEHGIDRVEEEEQTQEGRTSV